MVKRLYKKPETPNFADPLIQKAFVRSAHSHNELLQKEIEVNQAVQLLLKKRILMMKEFVNEIPSSDPQYSALLTQIQIDQIEWDELKLREESLQNSLRILK